MRYGPILLGGLLFGGHLASASADTLTRCGVIVRRADHAETSPHSPITHLPSESLGLELELDARGLSVEQILPKMRAPLSSMGYDEFEFHRTFASHTEDLYQYVAKIRDAHGEWREFVLEREVDSSGNATLVEFKTDTIFSDADLAVHLDAIAALESLGLRAATSEGGLHVHVGFADATQESLELLNELYAHFEADLYDHYSVHRLRRIAAALPWNLTPREDFASWLTRPRALLIHHRARTAMEMQALVATSLERVPDRRCSGLNLRALYKYGTAEVRLFNSTLKRSVIVSAVALSRQLVREARTQRGPLIETAVASPEGRRVPWDLIPASLSH